VTEAQRRTMPAGPRSPATPSAVTAATAAVVAGHESICSSAFTVGDTSGDVERQIVSSGSPYEPVVGFSRAVVAGGHVFVSGTAPIMPDGADLPGDAYSQARRCFEIIVAALAEAGATPRDVVRTRMYLVRPEDVEEVMRAHAELFADVRPAATGVIVSALFDPQWLVEIEVDALVPENTEA
jgi:enamine deaminase RidA (YjgF/YER057c/UK114 family)